MKKHIAVVVDDCTSAKVLIARAKPQVYVGNDGVDVSVFPLMLSNSNPPVELIRLIKQFVELSASLETMLKELESIPINAVTMPVSLKGVLRDLIATLLGISAGYTAKCKFWHLQSNTIRHNAISISRQAGQLRVHGVCSSSYSCCRRSPPGGCTSSHFLRGPFNYFKSLDGIFAKDPKPAAKSSPLTPSGKHEYINITPGTASQPSTEQSKKSEGTDKSKQAPVYGNIDNPGEAEARDLPKPIRKAYVTVPYDRKSPDAVKSRADSAYAQPNTGKVGFFAFDISLLIPNNPGVATISPAGARPACVRKPPQSRAMYR